MPKRGPLSPDEVATLRRHREQGGTRAQAAALVGCSTRTVTTHAPVGPFPRAIPASVKRRIRYLRYVEGLSSVQVAALAGMSPAAVRGVAPGRVGKIDNAKLREAFERSGLSAGDVARSIGWTYERASGPKAGATCADDTRVRRALGLQDDVAHGCRGRRVLIDAETAALIAEAIGVAPWSVGCDEDMSHLARAG